MSDVDDARSRSRSRVVSVRFPGDQHRLLKAYAALSESSVNAVVVEAVRQYLGTHADAKSIAALVERHRASLGSAHRTH